MEKRHFFVSRSGSDAQKALWLCSVLGRLGFSYHEQGQWPAGTNFIKAMGEAIDASDFTLALFSPAYFAPSSSYTENEWTAAHRRASLIGMKVEPCEVPTILAPFTYIPLTGGSLQQQQETVVAELAKLRYSRPPAETPWLPPRGTTTRTELREVRSLPDLCDREDEETRLQRAVEQRPPGKTVVMIVHGQEEQLPERFASRVEHVSVRELLTAPEPRVRPVVLPWPAARTVDDLEMKLKLAMEQHSLDGFAPEDAIVVSTHLDAADQPDRDLCALVKKYVEFWLDVAAGQACTMVICLAVRHPAVGLFDFRRRRAVNRMKQTIAELDDLARDGRCLAPEPLDSVPRLQVEHWAVLPRVRTVAEIDPDAIAALYPEGVTRIPMRTLVPILATLLERHRRSA